MLFVYVEMVLHFCCFWLSHFFLLHFIVIFTLAKWRSVQWIYISDVIPMVIIRYYFDSFILFFCMHVYVYWFWVRIKLVWLSENFLLFVFSFFFLFSFLRYNLALFCHWMFLTWEKLIVSLNQRIIFSV